MYRSSEINTVHLEITTRCNARCPMCLRTVSGGKTNPQLPLVDLRLDDIKTIFPDDFARQLKRIYMCGNYGDPIAARDTLAVFKHFRSVNPALRLDMFTNGSARPEDWWNQLAECVDNVRFAIDGLGETNALYRRNTDFDVIMRNARAFLRAGGTAQWDFIVFRHNEHQVEEARALALDMGFKSFQAKKTGRFFSNSKSAVKDRQEVLNENGDVEYYLEPPTDDANRNSSLGREEALIGKHGSMTAYLDGTKVVCKVAAEKSVYVSAEGLVFPCCWTANQLYVWYNEPRSSEVWKMIDALPGGADSINALKRPIREIIDGPFFQERVPAAWEKKSLREGKLRVCAKTCGSEFDPFRDQFR